METPLESIPTYTLTNEMYQRIAAHENPMSALLDRYGPIFRFTAPGHELYDAQNINDLLDEVVSINTSFHPNHATLIRKIKFQVYRTKEKAKYYRMSSQKPVVKTINLGSYIKTASNLNRHELDPSDADDIDKLCVVASQREINYVHNVVHNSKYRLDNNVFHNPANIHDPLSLLKRKSSNDRLGISDDWLYIGKRYTNSYLHTEEFGLPVVNTMLNNGSKFWLMTDRADNDKLIEKLRAITGSDDSCPYNYLDTRVILPASTLLQWKIKFYTCVQRQHETIVLGENIFHQVINLDFSVNSGVNFLSLPLCKGDRATCLCHHEGLKISGGELLASWRKQNKI